MRDLDSIAMKKTNQDGWAETLKTIVYAVVIAVSVRTVAFEPFNIPSGSMIPTLLIGDYLFVSKYSYGYSHYSMLLSPNLFSGRIFGKEPKRGDVAVFRNPKDVDTDFIKRVIGLPGDRIQMKNGILNINGEPVARRQISDFIDRDHDGTYERAAQYVETLPNGVEHLIIEYHGDTGEYDNTQEYLVPPGHYFMMGDNRDNSRDSRFLDSVGYVPAENLIGRAEFRFFSVDGHPWEVWHWRMKRFFTGIG